MTEPKPQSTSLGGRLLAGTLNYGLGSVLPQVVNFALVPVFTAYLSRDEYGLLELAASLGAVVVILLRLGLPGALTRFYFDHKEGAPLRDYVSSLTWLVLLASTVSGALMLLALHFAGDVLTPGLALFPYGLLVVLASFYSGNSDLQRRLAQAREQSAYTLKLNLLAAGLMTGLSLALVAGFELGAVGMLLAELVTNVLLFAQAAHYLRPELTGRFDWKRLRGTVNYALGVLPSQAVGTIAQSATRSILVGMQSLGELGLFAVASRFARPLSIVIMAFSTAYTPIYFAHRNDGSEDAHRALARATSAAWMLGVWGCLGVSTLGPLAIIAMMPAQFHEAATLVPWLALGWMAQVLSVVGSSEVYFQKATWFVPVVTAGVVVAQLAGTIALAKPFGATGLAIASAIGLWVNGLLFVGYSRHKVQLPIRWWALLRATVLGLGLGLHALLGPWTSFWQRLGVSLAVCAAFPAFLWVLRDPMVFEAAALVRSRLGKRRG